jgi:predicted transposase
MEIIRTTRLRIDIDAALAQRTVAAWSEAWNESSRVAFAHGCLSKAVKLHQLVYHEVRQRFGLSAQVAVWAPQERSVSRRAATV